MKVSTISVTPNTPKSKNEPKPKKRNSKNKLFAEDFFIPLDIQFFNDIEDGKMTPTMFCVYTMILKQVDYETGIASESGDKIAAGWGEQIPLRTAQKNMKLLEEGGYIKSFHQKGKRGNYPIAIYNYPIRYGTWKGYRLDALATIDPKRPVYRKDSESSASPNAPLGQDERQSDAQVTHDQRRSDAKVAHRQRQSNAKVASANACIPDNPDIPDGPENPDGPDAPDHPDHPKASSAPLPLDKEAASLPGSAGRLDHRTHTNIETDPVASLLPTGTGKNNKHPRHSDDIDKLKEAYMRKTGNVLPITRDERIQLQDEIKYLSDIGTDKDTVVLAFDIFLNRPKGIGDLTHPVKMFLNELSEYLFLAKQQSKEMESRISSVQDFVMEAFPGCDVNLPMSFIRSVQLYQPLSNQGNIDTKELTYQLTVAGRILGSVLDRSNDTDNLEEYYGIGTCQRLAEDIMDTMPDLKPSERVLYFNKTCAWLVDEDSNSPYGISYRKQAA